MTPAADEHQNRGSARGLLDLVRQKPLGLTVQDAVGIEQEIPDGTSTTLMIGERPPSSDMSIGSWYGGTALIPSSSQTLSPAVRGTTDFAMSATSTIDPVTGVRVNCPQPYVFQPGHILSGCSHNLFWSNHIGGAYFAFADGSTRFVSYSACTTRVQPQNITLLYALATRDGGEVASD